MEFLDNKNFKLHLANLMKEMPKSNGFRGLNRQERNAQRKPFSPIMGKLE